MRRILSAFGVTILWTISTLICFLLVLMLHEFVIILLEVLGWSPYVINFISKVAILLFGLAGVAFFLYIQNAYFAKRWLLFLPVSGFQLLLYASIKFIRILIAHQQTPVLEPIDIIAFLTSIGIGTLVLYCYHLLKNKKTQLLPNSNDSH